MPLKRYGERPTERKGRAVIDTGVLISAFAFGGVPEKAVKKAFAETDLYISLALLKEYREVPLALEREKKITPHQLKALISGLASIAAQAIVVYPRKKLSLCRDPQDNMLLECCLAAKADFLITGDKDLLDMHPLPFQLNIVSPRKFIELTRR
jgi:putative PIN family toxin of toxin-antitoxin system